MHNILVIGGTNIDDVVFLDKALPLDGKTDVAYSAQCIGGGGANVALALNALNKCFNDNKNIVLGTKLGQNIQTPKILHELGQSNISVLDVFDSYSTSPASNMVISHAAGRSILRTSTFNHASFEIPSHQAAQLKDTVRKADIIFVQTKHSRIALIAAQEAKEASIPVVVDFSNKECPDTLLDYADYALLPAEFRFHDMAEDSDSMTLLDNVAERVPYAAISDSIIPTLRKTDGQYLDIPSIPVQTKDSLGAGDLRDAAFCFFLMRDNAPDLALRKANIIASLSCEYYGRTWENDLPQRLAAYPEFTNDFPQTGYIPAAQIG